MIAMQNSTQNNSMKLNDSEEWGYKSINKIRSFSDASSSMSAVADCEGVDGDGG